MKVELVDIMGSDLSVVNAARVSYAKFKEEFEDRDEKLIKFLAEHHLPLISNYCFFFSSFF